MNQSKNWRTVANKLCAEIGPEDGIDPRIIARAMDKKSKGHKSQQLGKEAWHTVSIIFSGELSDPLFQDIEVLDVTVSDDGQFLVIALSQVDTGYEFDQAIVLEKCRAVQGYLRSAIADTVHRKRVPSLKFEWVPIKNEVSRDANF